MNDERRDWPSHGILERPYEWRIVALRFRASDSHEEASLDLCLARQAQTKFLRFSGVRDLRLDSGFPASPGLVFLDVGDRQLDGIGVRVTDLEAGPGGIHFWAKDVSELESPESPDREGK